MNYQDDVWIDDSALDVEWLQQAELAMKYVKHYAECRRTLTRAEEKIKIIRAELIAEANDDPRGCCNKDKPNAADIEAYYRADARHKAAKEEWVEAQYQLDMAEGAKNEIGFTRKMALENLVKLHGQAYFAGPKMPRDLATERKQKEQKEQEQNATRAGIAQQMSRRK